MADYPNTQRGEVKATIAGVDLILAAEMARIAQASAALNCQTLEELYKALTGGAPHVVMTALDIFTISGDVKAAKAGMMLDDISAAQTAFTEILTMNLRPARGNGAGAKAAAARPGATG